MMQKIKNFLTSPWVLWTLIISMVWKLFTTGGLFIDTINFSRQYLMEKTGENSWTSLNISFTPSQIMQNMYKIEEHFINIFFNGFIEILMIIAFLSSLLYFIINKKRKGLDIRTEKEKKQDNIFWIGFVALIITNLYILNLFNIDNKVKDIIYYASIYTYFFLYIKKTSTQRKKLNYSNVTKFENKISGILSKLFFLLLFSDTISSFLGYKGGKIYHQLTSNTMLFLVGTLWIISCISIQNKAKLPQSINKKPAKKPATKKQK